MKLSQDYKKQYKQILAVFFLLFLITPFLIIHAETAEELRNKIDQKDADISKLQAEIRAYQSQLDDLGKQKDSLSGSLKQLDLTKKKLNVDISVTQTKIDKTNLRIESLSHDIGNKADAISNNLNAIASGIRQTSEFEETNLVGELLSKDNFTTMWNDVDNILTIRDSLKDNINTLRTLKGELEDTRTSTISAKMELVSLQTQLLDQKKIIVQNANEKAALLKQTQNNEANYQKLLKEGVAKKEAFEKELKDFESQLKFILDPSKLPGAGVLSWPLDDIYVTQQFGAKTGPHRTYANGHSGTDFRARTPVPVKAMADGVVKGTGNTDTICPGVSFGQWIFIEYNNGLSSTYGHLSLIKVKEGQKVRRGEIVGYTGGTGRVTGPHLHVSLYVASAVKVATVPSLSCPGKILKQPIAPVNAYLDPMYYLPGGQ